MPEKEERILKGVCVAIGGIMFEENDNGRSRRQSGSSTFEDLRGVSTSTGISSIISTYLGSNKGGWLYGVSVLRSSQILLCLSLRLLAQYPPWRHHRIRHGRPDFRRSGRNALPSEISPLLNNRGSSYNEEVIHTGSAEAWKAMMINSPSPCPGTKLLSQPSEIGLWMPNSSSTMIL
jgi:hypothetical protein